jgi:hypothetical protein
VAEKDIALAQTDVTIRTRQILYEITPVRTRAAVAVLIALGLRALMHTAAIFEWPAVLSWDAVQTVTIESHWGSAWQLQVAAAVILLAASVWAGHER